MAVSDEDIVWVLHSPDKNGFWRGIEKCFSTSVVWEYSSESEAVAALTKMGEVGRYFVAWALPRTDTGLVVPPVGTPPFRTARPMNDKDKKMIEFCDYMLHGFGQEGMDYFLTGYIDADGVAERVGLDPEDVDPQLRQLWEAYCRAGARIREYCEQAGGRRDGVA